MYLYPQGSHDHNSAVNVFNKLLSENYIQGTVLCVFVINLG